MIGTTFVLFHLSRTFMKKVTLTFPTYDSLWLFKEKTKAIHIRIEPKKHTMSGLFQQQEVQLAVEQFHASPMQQPA
jgi:hypothetical protein